MSAKPAPAHPHAHAHTRRHLRRLFEALFAFVVCLVLYALVMTGSVWFPLFLGGEKIKPLVAFVLMPMDVMMLGWNQPWYLLAFHLLTTAAAFALSRAATEKQFKLMLIAFATCALVSAVNDALKAYRMLHRSHPAT
ncbi:MAG: hypothetical protein PHS14_06265 [Elusimicrobia bacterium]|nr:hypothetical protein [Elusimicrobiota bacterium]